MRSFSLRHRANLLLINAEPGAWHGQWVLRALALAGSTNVGTSPQCVQCGIGNSCLIKTYLGLLPKDLNNVPAFSCPHVLPSAMEGVQHLHMHRLRQQEG